MKNYSLLIMGGSNDDDGGGGVDGDGSGGNSPSWQGAETETSVPRIRVFGGSGATEPVSYTHLTLPTNREV